MHDRAPRPVLKAVVVFMIHSFGTLPTSLWVIPEHFLALFPHTHPRYIRTPSTHAVPLGKEAPYLTFAYNTSAMSLEASAGLLL